MAQIPPRSDSCPFCWTSKHLCQRDPVTGVCRDCRPHVTRILGGGGIVTYASSFYDSAAHAELFKTTELSSLSSLDVEIGSEDVNALSIQTTTSSGHKSKVYVFKIRSRFNTENAELIQELDTMVRECLTISLEDEVGYCHAVRKVVLAGGYAHLLCSTIRAKETVSTIRDGVDANNEHNQYNLLTQLRFVVLCRLSELLKGIMDAVRFEDTDNEFVVYTADAFASAVVLRYEMGYFARSLRNGELSSIGHMSDRLRAIIIAWFEAIEQELSHHLRLGCGQHIHWQGKIAGSKKRARRGAQTLELALDLQQRKHTVGEPPPASTFYAANGNGNHMLPRADTPTMFTALQPFYGIDAQEVNHPPSHVSDPLSNLFDTWEETSDYTDICDLFPESQPYLRYPDEGDVLIE